MNENWNLQRDGNPVETGWYATIHCWDAHEGFFDQAIFYTNGLWCMDRLPIVAWYGPFETQQEATVYGETNNWDNGGLY